VEATNMGYYFKTNFTGTSCGLSLALVPGNSIKVGWTIDDGPCRYAVLTSAVHSLPLATGLSPGPHSIFFYLSANISGVRWSNNPGVRILGLALDPEASLSSPVIQPKLLVIYGDSIAEGQDLAGTSDSFRTFCFAVAQQLNAELALLAFAGQAYTVGVPFNGTDVPPLYTPSHDEQSSWNKYWSNHSLLNDSGHFLHQPDYIINELSRNDAFFVTNGQTTAAAMRDSIQGWLTAARAAAPRAWIFPMVNFAQGLAGDVCDAFTAYQKAASDSKCVLIDLGTSYSKGLTAQLPGGNPFSATFESVDGVHPNSDTHGRIAAAMTALIHEAIHHGGGPSGILKH
jgi:lysophospholipase L1-like esterase